MNTETYTSLLANPQQLTKEQLKELNAIIATYPYFQSARALQLKGLKNENSFLYNDALKVTAAYTTDRDILFDYITSETFAQDEISGRILEQSDAVRQIEVVSENISEALSLELDKQMKVEMQKAEAILDPALFERKEEEIAKISEEVSPENTLEETTTELATDTPLAFGKADTHSFGEWLKLTKAQPIERIAEIEKPEAPQPAAPQDARERKYELIEKFIQERPKIKPEKTNEKKENLAKPYTQVSDSLMTETLAKVYLQQKNYKKAIQDYKILILKNPEKSGFFADQIRAIQKLIKAEKWLSLQYS